jgi:DNA-binding NtrC family response regulator
MINSLINDEFETPSNSDEQNGSESTSPPRRTAAYPTDVDLVGRSQAPDESDVDEWVPLSVIEGRYVAKVLAHTRGNKQAAARVLGIDRKTLDRMIKRHNIETGSFRNRAKPPSAAVNSATHP